VSWVVRVTVPGPGTQIEWRRCTDSVTREGQSLPPSWRQRRGRESAPRQAVHGPLRSMARVMGLTPSEAESDIWMREADDACECAAMCVDDLVVASKGPQGVMTCLKRHRSLTLGGTGPAASHLGCDHTQQTGGVSGHHWC